MYYINAICITLLICNYDDDAFDVEDLGCDARGNLSSVSDYMPRSKFEIYAAVGIVGSGRGI